MTYLKNKWCHPWTALRFPLKPRFCTVSLINSSIITETTSSVTSCASGFWIMSIMFAHHGGHWMGFDAFFSKRQVRRKWVKKKMVSLSFLFWWQFKMLLRPLPLNLLARGWFAVFTLKKPYLVAQMVVIVINYQLGVITIINPWSSWVEIRPLPWATKYPILCKP